MYNTITNINGLSWITSHMEANIISLLTETENALSETIDSDLDLRLLHDHHGAMRMVSTVVAHAPHNRPVPNTETSDDDHCQVH